MRGLGWMMVAAAAALVLLAGITPVLSDAAERGAGAPRTTLTPSTPGP